MTAIFGYEVENQLKEEFFGRSKRGFFVDVGANDPVVGSQTWHLEQLGWDGVLVEPQRDLAEKLRQRRRAKVYPVACSSPANSGKTMTLHLAGIQSSLKPDFFVPDMRPDGVSEVPISTLDEILTESNAPAPLDLVSIDVETHEIEVLNGFDLARWRPKLILIEDIVLNLRLHRYLASKGYKWIRRTGLNGWYVPIDRTFRISPFGRLQFFRKYYLGVPFRVARETLRPLRHRLNERWGNLRLKARTNALD
jgi:FkbM family methyltransferase